MFSWRSGIAGLLGIALLMSATQFSWAGSESSGGSDAPSNKDVAMWFTSLNASRIIHYCVDASSDFGFTEEQLAPLIEQAFKAWADYMEIRKPLNGSTGWRPPRTLSHLPKCNGSQDVKFYFGSTSREVEKAKKRFYNPFAFAIRTDYDAEQYWGRGFVWLANPGTVQPYLHTPPKSFPNWQKPNNLYAVLLHEIGHIYGCGHITNTIMRPNLADVLLDELAYGGFRTKIDHQRELFRSIRAFQLSSQLELPDRTEVDEIVRRMTGAVPTESRAIRIEANNDRYFDISFQTRTGESTIHLTMGLTGMRSDPVFKTGGGYEDDNLSGLYSGAITGADGQPVILQIEYNMQGVPNFVGHSPFMLYAFHNGYRILLAEFKDSL